MDIRLKKRSYFNDRDHRELWNISDTFVWTKDEDAIEFLIKYLRLTKVQDVVNIVASFYDVKLIQLKTQYMIEEIIEASKYAPERKQKN